MSDYNVMQECRSYTTVQDLSLGSSDGPPSKPASPGGLHERKLVLTNISFKRLLGLLSALRRIRPLTLTRQKSWRE